MVTVCWSLIFSPTETYIVLGESVKVLPWKSLRGERRDERYRRGFRFLVVHGHGRVQIQLFQISGRIICAPDRVEMCNWILVPEKCF